VESTRAVLNYSIENGKLVKQAAPGRSKMEACEAVEKNGNQMVLKCTNIYFFMTKK
jgi:exopolysaccharide biosynthesis protein